MTYLYKSHFVFYYYYFQQRTYIALIISFLYSTAIPVLRCRYVHKLHDKVLREPERLATVFLFGFLPKQRRATSNFTHTAACSDLQPGTLSQRTDQTLMFVEFIIIFKLCSVLSVQIPLFPGILKVSIIIQLYI